MTTTTTTTTARALAVALALALAVALALARRRILVMPAMLRLLHSRHNLFHGRPPAFVENIPYNSSYTTPETTMLLFVYWQNEVENEFSQA